MTSVGMFTSLFTTPYNHNELHKKKIIPYIIIIIIFLLKLYK